MLKDSACPRAEAHCDTCDLLVGLDGLHVVEVTKTDRALVVTVESGPTVMGPRCRVVADSHGRRTVSLVGGRSVLRPGRPGVC